MIPLYRLWRHFQRRGYPPRAIREVIFWRRSVFSLFVSCMLLSIALVFCLHKLLINYLFP